MPTPYIKKLADEGYGSIESLENKWGEAKSKASEHGKGSNYGLVTRIFQQMIGASVHLEATQRLQSTRAGLPEEPAT